MPSCAVLNAAWPGNLVQVTSTPITSCNSYVVLDSTDWAKVNQVLTASAPVASTFDAVQAAEFWTFGLSIVMFCYLIAVKAGVILSMIRRR